MIITVYALLHGATASRFPLFVIPLYKRLGVQTASYFLAIACLVLALLMLVGSKKARI